VGVDCIAYSRITVGARSYPVQPVGFCVGLTISINDASLYHRDSSLDGTRGLYSSLTTPAIGRCSVVVLLVVSSIPALRTTLACIAAVDVLLGTRASLVNLLVVDPRC
jgi:hypothetical protein